MLITSKHYLGSLFLLLIIGCGVGGGETASTKTTATATSTAANSTVAAPVCKSFGIFTNFTSARALSFSLSGIKLLHAYTSDGSMMVANPEQNKIAIISLKAWPQGEPILTFDGDVSGVVELSNIEQLSENLQLLPPFVEIRAIAK